MQWLILLPSGKAAETTTGQGTISAKTAEGRRRRGVLFTSANCKARWCHSAASLPPTRPNPRAVPIARDRGLQQLSPDSREANGPSRPAHHGARLGPASRRCRPARPHSRDINPPACRSWPAHPEVTPGSRREQGPPELSDQLPAQAGLRSAETVPRRTALASPLHPRQPATSGKGRDACHGARPAGPLVTALSGFGGPACSGQGTAVTPTT